jgi:hypothetical protein
LPLTLLWTLVHFFLFFFIATCLFFLYTKYLREIATRN